jgi:hypothetical protein
VTEATTNSGCTISEVYMVIKILYAIVTVAVILGVCSAVKLLCKKYINSIDKKQSKEVEYYVQANFKN